MLVAPFITSIMTGWCLEDTEGWGFQWKKLCYRIAGDKTGKN
jgi:hypothetical protein